MKTLVLCFKASGYGHHAYSFPLLNRLEKISNLQSNDILHLTREDADGKTDRIRVYNIRIPNKDTPRSLVFNRILKEVNFIYDHNEGFLKARVPNKIYELLNGISEVKADKDWFDKAMTMPFNELHDSIILLETIMRLQTK